MTVNSREKSVYGNHRIQILEITASAASETIDTGLSKVLGHSIGPISMNSAAPLMKSDGGNIVLSNATSGDHFYLVAYGS